MEKVIKFQVEVSSAEFYELRARGVSKDEWIASPKRVRQQSVKCSSGYMQEFNLDVFEHLRARL